MNWEALGAIAETLGALGVIATLAFVAIQVRQNKQSVDANTASLAQSRDMAEAHAYENRTRMILDFLAAARDSHFIAEAYGVPKESAAKVRSDVSLRWMCNYLDNLHYQYERGHLDADYHATQYVGSVKTFAPLWRKAGVNEPRKAFKSDVDRILEET